MTRDATEGQRVPGDADLRPDPPPDLALEIDVSHSSLDRLAIDAALGFPEVWRYDGQTLTCHVLDASGRHTASPLSRAFPGLRVSALPASLTPRQADENGIVRQQRPAGGPPPSPP